MPLGDDFSRRAPGGAYFTTSGTLGFKNSTGQSYDVGVAMSVGVWVRPTSLPGSGLEEDVFRVNTDAVPTGDQIVIGLKEDGAGNTHWFFTTSDAGGASVLQTVGTVNVVAGQWYYVVGSLLSSASQQLLVNATVENTDSAVGHTTSNVVNRISSIGLDGNADTKNFDGDIHSIALWSSALPEESVRATYSGGWRNFDVTDSKHPHYNEASTLQHWWRLGQPATTTYSSGNELLTDWVAAGGISITTEVGTIEQEALLTPGSGPAGVSVQFSGTDMLSMPTALSLDMTNAWSISVWAKPQEALTTFGDQVMLGAHNATSGSTVSISRRSLRLRMEAADSTDIANWTVTGSGTTGNDDTGVSHSGNASIRLDRDGQDSDSPWIDLDDVETGKTVDLTNQSVSMWLRVDDVSEINQSDEAIRIYLSSDASFGGPNQWAWSQPRSVITGDNVWSQVTWDLSGAMTSDSVGTVDMSAIRMIAIVVWDRGLAFPHSIWYDDLEVAERLHIGLTNDAGANLASMYYDNVLLQNFWQNIVVTYDGTDVKTYKDGTLLTATSDSVIGSGVQTNIARKIELGGSSYSTPADFYTGKLGHIGMWDSELTQNDIDSIVSHGNALDLRYNVGSYASAENLVSYLKPGEDTIVMARNFLDVHRSIPGLAASDVTGTPLVSGDSPIFPNPLGG